MKKMKLIALTMVVALMMVGAGYAAWTDTLTINHTVNTGYLDVHFVDLADEITDENDSRYIDGSVVYDVDDEVNDGQEDRSAGKLDKAIITVNRAYPGSKYSINLRIKNSGTMPVKLDVNDLLNQYNARSNNEIAKFVKTYEVKLDNNDYRGQDIAPGKELNILFNLEATENIQESTPYTMTIQPKFIQFNK